MLYYVYAMEIYDGMNLRILYKNVFLTTMKSWLTLYQEVVRVLGDGYKGSLEENIYHIPYVHSIIDYNNIYLI